jgi:hypothetical protein
MKVMGIFALPFSIWSERTRTRLCTREAHGGDWQRSFTEFLKKHICSSYAPSGVLEPQKGKSFGRCKLWTGLIHDNIEYSVMCWHAALSEEAILFSRLCLPIYDLSVLNGGSSP